MGITSEDPSKDPTKGRQSWEYDAPGRGETRHGYYAGHTLWVYVHHEHGSRPCRARVSKGALSCPMCACDAAFVQRGYVAYYTRDLVPSFFISPEKFRRNIATVETAEQVVLKRGKKVYDAVVMRPETFRPLKLPADLPVGDRVDLVPSLLRLWKDVQLERWHCSTLTSDIPVSPVPPSGEDSNPYANAPPDLLARLPPRVRDIIEQEAAGIVRDQVNRLTWPGKESKNGVHPPADGS